MENKVVGFVPRILFKIFLILREKFDPKPPIPEEEKITVQICKRLLEDKTSSLFLAPSSHKRFIVNKNRDMFIVIYDHTINLINHVYSYSVYLSDTQSYREITEIFDKILDDERLKLEDEIKSNIQHSLESILKKFD